MSSRNPFGDTTGGVGDDRNTTGGGGGGGDDDDDDDDDDRGSVGDDRNTVGGGSSGGSSGGSRDDDDDDDDSPALGGGGAPDAGDDRNTVGGGDSGSSGGSDEPALGGGGAPDARDDRNTVGGGDSSGSDEPALGGGDAPDMGDDRNTVGDPPESDIGDDRNMVSDDPMDSEPASGRDMVGDDRNTVGQTLEQRQRNQAAREFDAQTPGTDIDASDIRFDEETVTVDEETRREIEGVEGTFANVGRSPAGRRQTIAEAREAQRTSATEPQNEPGFADRVASQALQDAAQSPLGQTTGLIADATFGRDAFESEQPSVAERADSALAGLDRGFEQRITEPIREADPDAVDPQSAGLVRPFGISGEDIQDVTAESAQFANVPAFGRDIIAGSRATSAAGEFVVEEGPEGVQTASEVGAAGARAAPGAARAGVESVRENPRDAAVTGTALLGTAAAGTAASRIGRRTASTGRRVASEVDAGSLRASNIADIDEIRARAPDVSVRRDADAPALEVDDLLQEQIRDTVTPTRRPRSAETADVDADDVTPADTTTDDVFGRNQPFANAARREFSVAADRGRDLVERATRPAGDTTADVFGTAGRPAEAGSVDVSGRLDDLGERAASADERGRDLAARATQPAGDTTADVFGRNQPFANAARREFSVAADRGRDLVERATRPAGDTTADVFGTAGRPATARATELDLDFDLRARAGGAVERATRPAGDTTADVFGTAGRPATARATRSEGDSLLDRSVAAATEPAGDSPSDIFGTAARSGESIFDTTVRIGPARPRRTGRTVDADDVELQPGAIDDDDIPGGRQADIDDATDDVAGGSAGGGGERIPTRGGSQQVAVQRPRARTPDRDIDADAVDSSFGLADETAGTGFAVGSPEGLTGDIDASGPFDAGADVDPTVSADDAGLVPDRDLGPTDDVDLGQGPEQLPGVDTGLGNRVGSDTDQQITQTPTTRTRLDEPQRLEQRTAAREAQTTRRPRTPDPELEIGTFDDDPRRTPIGEDAFRFTLNPEQGLFGEDI